jgi:hypothetical protein
VYDTLVRMAPFSLRYMLVDGQGNFGSVDGDNAAAMRYTEARMSRLGTSCWPTSTRKPSISPNYDEKELEPTVMPTRFPNLLVNGSAGIAVGMATNIPPHNLSESINACIALIDNPDIDVDGLMGTSRARISRPPASSTAPPASSRLPHRPWPRAHPCQGRYRSGRQRPRIDHRHRDSLPGEQGASDREDRRAGQGKEDRRHQRAARRVRQGRHAHRTSRSSAANLPRLC